jgi:hypothetical protein
VLNCDFRDALSCLEQDLKAWRISATRNGGRLLIELRHNVVGLLLEIGSSEFLPLKMYSYAFGEFGGKLRREGGNATATTLTSSHSSNPPKQCTSHCWHDGKANTATASKKCGVVRRDAA